MGCPARGKKSHWGLPLGGPTPITHRRKQNHHSRKLHSVGSSPQSQFEMVQCWAQKVEGNLSFSRDMEALASYFRPKRKLFRHSITSFKVLPLKLKLCPVTLTELSFGVEGTQTALRPKLNPSRSSTSCGLAGLSSVSAKSWHEGQKVIPWCKSPKG